jgi:hypothetical protein
MKVSYCDFVSIWFQMKGVDNVLIVLLFLHS